MKRFVQWGVVLSVCATTTTANGQSPWESAGKWLTTKPAPSRTLTFKTAMQGETPAPPRPAVEAMPSPSDAAAPAPATQEEAPLGSGAITDEAKSTYELYKNGEGLGYTEGCCDIGCAPGSCCGWFGGIYALGLRLHDDHGVDLSYNGLNPYPALLTTHSASVDYGPGFETRFGKYLSCCWGVEASYWGIFPESQEAYICNTCDSVDLASAINFDGLLYDNGTLVDSVSLWFGTPTGPAQVHRLRRDFDAHNIEINLIRNPCRRNGCMHFELIAGFRYLQLNEKFGFATDLTSDTFGDDPVNELYYDIDVDNHLFGFQVGGRVDHYIWKKLSVNGGSKFGIYGNHITHSQTMASGDGVLATNVNTGEGYRFNVSDNEVAFVGELFAGVSYDVTCKWRLTGGYRAITACGVARTTSNIPRAGEFGSWDRVRATDSNDCLLLHGAYAGIEYNW